MADTPRAPTPPVPVVLDTDIGSDVDDLLALLVLATDPGVRLEAVTTVYGDTALRARIAGRVLGLLDRQDVAVHVGEPIPLSGREVKWFGHEGEGVDGLDDAEVEATGALDALAAALERHAGTLAVVTIGPLTNLASLLRRRPDLTRSIGQLVVMGGEFVDGHPEHNLRSDAVAARIVLGSGIPTRVVGLDVTTRVVLDEDDLTTITTTDTQLARLVDQQVRAWWEVIGRGGNALHDPLAALMLLEPGLFGFRTGGWRVSQDGERSGALLEDPTQPPIEHASDVDVEVAHRSIVTRLAAAISGAPA